MFENEKELSDFFISRVKNFNSLMGLPDIQLIRREYVTKQDFFYKENNEFKSNKPITRRIDLITAHVDGSTTIYELKHKSGKKYDLDNLGSGVFQILNYKNIIEDNNPQTKVRLFMIAPYIDKESAKICHQYNIPIRFIYITKDGFEEYEVMKENG